MDDASRLTVLHETSRILSHAQAIQKQLQREVPDRGYMLTHAISIQESIPLLVEQLKRWDSTE